MKSIKCMQHSDQLKPPYWGKEMFDVPCQEFFCFMTTEKLSKDGPDNTLDCARPSRCDMLQKRMALREGGSILPSS